MTIAIDAMGGDNAPNEIIKGALDSLQVTSSKIILVGKEDVIKKELSPHHTDRIEIVPATQVIETDEGAAAIKEKKDSSIVVGLDLLRAGRCDSFISAGSTGALLTGATLKIKRISGIRRPALATLLPCATGHVILLDSGANVDCKADYLLQFAILGSAYMEHIHGVKDPFVGLLNIGSEKDKGNTLTKETYDLLLKSSLNFYGNIEARDIATGTVHVAVCDGFCGNLVLKTAEGYSKFIFDTIKKELMATTIRKAGAFLSKGAFKNIKKSLDYSEVGGAPFLGLQSLVIKSHGSAKAKDIVGAVKQAQKFIQNDTINKIQAITKNLALA